MNYSGRTMKKLILIFSTLSFLFLSCAEQPPVAVDGEGRIEVVVLWDSTYSENTSTSLPVTNAKVFLSSRYGMRISVTDENGKIYLENLPTSTYGLSVRKPHPVDPNIMLIGAKQDLSVISGRTLHDTIFVKPISATGIVINEIYAAGPVNNIFYFYDQFIELYNASDSVRYLDGMIVMRVSGNNEGKGPGADEDDDGDIDGVVYAFKFPGYPGEKNIPIYPKQFIVLAVDAVNHKNMISTSIDLSSADWEFYNQYSPEDIDNPNVPNLINVLPFRTQDFLINLAADVIVVADGRDSVLLDGVDISTIVDGVEYQPNPHPQSKKTLDPRVDRGYVLSPPRYSGKSIQRKEPGFDTNDSSTDFEIIDPPTPGRQ
jgi:hypothetical protein